MYSLIKGLVQWMSKKDDLKVCVLGLDFAGKTSIVEKLKALFSETSTSATAKEPSPTVGLNIATINYDRKYSVILWDLGGQSSLRSIWQQYCYECDGIIFVVDTTDPSRFEEAKSCLESLTDSINRFHNKSGFCVPIAIFLNKCEDEKQSGAQDTNHIPEYLQSERVTENIAHVACCSAKKGTNMKHALDVLVASIIHRRT